MRSRLPSQLITACLVAAIGGTLALPSAGAAVRHPDGRTQTRASAPVSDEAAAKATLASARAVLAGRSTGSQRRTIRGQSPRDATMVLTALRRSLGDLSGADLASARRVLARPTDVVSNPDVPEEHVYTVPEATPSCSSDICVHYVTSTTDSVGTADSNSNGLPDYVDGVKSVLANVYATEITQMGYRAPLSDSSVDSHGPDSKLDVYLEDLPDGLYGYCVPDTDAKQSSGYCVLDNDYSQAEYPTNTPVENLEVTAAHEFFHAVQFGYDSWEDTWLMEGTAAWMEDQAYDDVNDNYQYLGESPLTNPYIPLDFTGTINDGGSQHDYSSYGSWLFFRYLSESRGRGRADDPSIIRQIWDNAVGSRYSTQAVTKTLSDRGSSLRSAWNVFGSWLADPADYFREGAAYKARYGSAFRDSDTVLTKAAPATTSGRGGFETDHLTHSFNMLKPGSSLTGTWNLRVHVNMPYKVRGTAARLITKHRDGSFSVVGIPLNAKGDGTKTVRFSRTSVASVNLDLLSTSVRYTCGQGQPFACFGNPVDDGNVATFSARAVR